MTRANCKDSLSFPPRCQHCANVPDIAEETQLIVRTFDITIIVLYILSQSRRVKVINMPSNEPELLYVNSKIVEPSKLSPELFTNWYNDVHIPDIFKTTGIQEAFRYYTTAEDPSSIERPYLALYPIKSKGFLQSAQFRSIPVQSDMLPGPSHDIFDVADFDTRYYTLKSNARPFDGTVSVGLAD